MRRIEMLQKLKTRMDPFDVAIIGGGATGLFSALDAASRGLKTVLLEKGDFAHATSSRSTKLIHGGVRYLEKLQLGLVREALHERGFLSQNAPHLVTTRPFLIPCTSIWEKFYYGLGMFLYDQLSGRLLLKKHKLLSKKACETLCPNLDTAFLQGGCLYYDGQFDDARFAIELAQTAFSYGAILLNYSEVHSFQKKDSKICSMFVKDHILSEMYEIRAKTFVNAGGIFVDQIRQMDDSQCKPVMVFSRGSHVLLPRSFFPGETALLVPKTKDKRVVFVIPWKNNVMIGTTDIFVPHPIDDPVPTKEEIDFLFEQSAPYLKHKPEKKDILSVYAGIRPLVKRSEKKSTKNLSRSHKIFVSKSGLITVAGGKWTTARKMAQDTIDKVLKIGSFKAGKCKTKHIKIHESLSFSEEERLHPAFPYSHEDIIYAIRQEMPETLMDLMARRTRMLYINAKEAIHMAPKMAEILAHELNKDASWREKTLKEFLTQAKKYCV